MCVRTKYIVDFKERREMCKKNSGSEETPKVCEFIAFSLIN